MSKHVFPLVGDGLFVRRVRVEARHVVYVKGIIEASEGLACVFAERGGDLWLVAPAGREADLDMVVEGLRTEVSAIVSA